jgi:hypothetical protein
MFPGAKTVLTLAVGAALAAGLSACDLSQKKPETTATLQGAAGLSAAHERSVRLYGPGVSRQRQTRI